MQSAPCATGKKTPRRPALEFESVAVKRAMRPNEDNTIWLATTQKEQLRRLQDLSMHHARERVALELMIEVRSSGYRPRNCNT